jgi:Zn-dependent peptidase ImmA (M78 family)/DNA-binding XRE family transcriptional regulator
MIYGRRIKQAREFKGMTQTQLAELVSVKQSAISQIEKDEFTPSDELVRAIAASTGFAPSFFELEPTGDLPLGTLNYRSRKSVTAREETKAYQYANLLYTQIKDIVLDTTVPPNNIPQLSNVKALKAARITRSAFGLSPDEPIKNLLHVLEKNGVFIFTIPREIQKIDAFSTWADLDESRPIIIIISGKPMDRMRFSVGHEVGHLVIHRSLKPSLKLIENEANEFASEFLMPEKAMRDEMTPPITLTSVARLKLRWGVPMQALIMRARGLKIITERQAKYLFAQLSAQGWRTREPANLDIKHELPNLVRDMIESKYKTREDYAIGTHLDVSTATELYAYA